MQFRDDLATKNPQVRARDEITESKEKNPAAGRNAGKESEVYASQEWRVLGIPPSKFVVANALRNALPEFLIASSESDSLAKFVADRQNNENMPIFRLAS